MARPNNLCVTYVKGGIIHLCVANGWREDWSDRVAYRFATD